MKSFRTLFLLDLLLLLVAFLLPGLLNIAPLPGRAPGVDPLVFQGALLVYVFVSWTAVMYSGGTPNPRRARPGGLLFALIALCLVACFPIAWEAFYRPSWSWLATFGAASFLLLVPARLIAGTRGKESGNGGRGCALLALAGILFALACALRFAIGFAAWKILRFPLVIAGTLSLCAFYAAAGSCRLDSRIAAKITARGWRWAGAAALIAVIAAAVLSQSVLNGIPHVQDSIATLFQARIFASGKLYAAAPSLPEAFDCEFIVLDGSRWYGKYFPGASLLLAAGVLAGAPWLVNPVLGGLSLVVIFLLAKELFDDRVAKASVILALLSPFFLFMSASHMSHPASLLFSSFFLFTVVKSTRRDRSLLWPLAGGCALGLNLITRPYTALLTGIPPILYFLADGRSRKDLIKRFLVFAVPLAFFAAVIGCYNRALTGDPFLFPFVRYNPGDFFGYGKSIGISHLPERGYSLRVGIANFKDNLTVLSKDLFGWPRWTFLFIFVPLFSPYRRREDLLLVTLFAVLAAGYSLWWYHGICFGARFWYEAMPAYLILAARTLQVVWRAARRRGVNPNLFAAALVIFLTACCATTYFPERLRFYGNGYRGIDDVLKGELGRRGITGGLIFVEGKHYATPEGKGYPDAYLSAFMLNDVDLAGDIVCAREMDAANNMLLAEQFPNLKPYIFIHPDPEYSPSRAGDGSGLPILAPLHLRDQHNRNGE